MPSPLGHRIEWNKGLEPGDVHAKRKLAVSDLKGTFSVELGERHVVPTDEGMTVNWFLLKQKQRGKVRREHESFIIRTYDFLTKIRKV